MSISFKQLPGPKGLPFVGSLHKVTFTDLHNHFENWANEYGGVYKLKLGPSKITVVTKPEIIQEILKARPKGFIRMRKMDKILRAEGVHGLFNAEGEEWKIHRRIIAKGLDVKHQQQFFPSIVNTVERFYKKLNSVCIKNDNYSIQDDLLRFTVDVTTTLAFGIDMNTLEQEGGVIQEHMDKLFPVIFKRINEPFPLYKIYKTKKDREFDKAVKAVDKLIDGFIETGRERIRNNSELKENPSNLLESIILAAEEESIFEDKDIKGNLLTLLMAGEDTTAHSLSWIIFFLCQHTDVQEKLHKEASEILLDEHFLTNYSKLSELPYTEAVINEAIRLKPVAPIMIFEPTEDIEIDNYLFSKGCKIFTQFRLGSTSDTYFSNGKTFLPERWLKDNSVSKCPVHNIDAYTPFGSGPRFCPGKNLAMLEMKMILTMLMKNFTVEMITPINEINEIMAFTMTPSQFSIRLKKRINNN